MTVDLMRQFMAYHQGQFVLIQAERHQPGSKDDAPGSRKGINRPVMGIHHDGVFRGQVLRIKGHRELLPFPVDKQLYRTRQVPPPRFHHHMADVQHQRHQNLSRQGQKIETFGVVAHGVAAAPVPPEQVSGEFPDRPNLAIPLGHPGMNGPVVYADDQIPLPQADIISRRRAPDIIYDNLVAFRDPPVEP